MNIQEAHNSIKPPAFFLALGIVILSVVLALASTSKIFLDPSSRFSGTDPALSVVGAFVLMLIVDIVFIVGGLIALLKLASSLKKNENHDIQAVTILFSLLGLAALIYLAVGWFS